MKKNIFSLILLFCSFLLIFSNFINISVNANSHKEENLYTAKSLYLIDYNTNTVLYEKNITDKIPVASIVKLMTICLTCEEIESNNLKVDDIIIASENASSMGGSQVFIEAGGEYSVGDLLKSTIISSANDASVALAEKICGSEAEFVKKMNYKAKELGMDNTNYVNCTGLPAANQFSSAKDTAILLKEVLRHNNYHNYSTIWTDTLKHPKSRETELVNTNKLIRYYDGCDGGKTGSTSEAGYCLAATAKRNNMRLIAVVLGAENGKLRFAETSKLLNFGFNNFENKIIVDNKEILNLDIKNLSTKQDNLKVKVNENIYILSKKFETDNEKILTKIVADKNINVPIKAGDKVGTIYIIKDGKVIKEVSVFSLEQITKANFYDDIVKVVESWNIRG